MAERIELNSQSLAAQLQQGLEMAQVGIKGKTEEGQPIPPNLAGLALMMGYTRLRDTLELARRTGIDSKLPEDLINQTVQFLSDHGKKAHDFALKYTLRL